MASEPAGIPSAPSQALGAKIRVWKKNIQGGVRYEVGLSPYVSGIFYAAAALCVGAGILGWNFMPREQAVPLSFLFGLNAFITAMAGASIHTLKRPIEVGTAGFTLGGKTAPLARIDAITVTRGPLCRLRVDAGADVVEMMMDRRQAEWLKADIENELQTRRTQTPKKGAQ